MVPLPGHAGFKRALHSFCRDDRLIHTYTPAIGGHIRSVRTLIPTDTSTFRQTHQTRTYMRHVTTLKRGALCFGLLLVPFTASAQQRTGPSSDPAPMILSSKALSSFDLTDRADKITTALKTLRQHSDSNAGIAFLTPERSADNTSATSGGSLRAKASVPGAAFDESHILAIAGQYIMMEFGPSEPGTSEGSEQATWVTEEIVEFERNESGLPTSITETFQSYDYDEDFNLVQRLVTMQTQFDYTAGGLIETMTVTADYFGVEAVLGFVTITYDSEGKMTGTVEIYLDEVTEENIPVYDTTSVEISYTDGKASATYISDGFEGTANADTATFSAIEGDTLIIESYDSYLDVDFETGDTLRVRESYRMIYPGLGTLTQYFNTVVLYYQDLIEVSEEYFDDELSAYVPDYRQTSITTDSTYVATFEYWEEDESEWITEGTSTVTLDDQGKASQVDNLYYDGGEVYPGGRDLINPATEVLQFVSVEDEAGRDQPASFSLQQNYPNPFNPSTQIAFELLTSGKVSLKVFDVMGRQVASLVDQTLAAGTHSVTFDASSLSSGVYFYRLQVATGAGDGVAPFIQTRSMILQK